MISSNNEVTRSFQKGLNITNQAVSKTENLQKVAKITSTTIEFVALLTGKVVTAFKLLSSRLRDTSDVIESFCLIGRVKELACPDKGEYFLKKNTWQKCADRIFLTAAAVFKTINIAAKFAFINLGKAAKFAVGNVPVLRLIPDTLIMISSFFSLWDNKNVSRNKSEKVAEAACKAQKWLYRPLIIDNVRSGNNETIFSLKNNYEMKCALLERQIHGLNPDVHSREIAKKSAVLNKYRDRLSLIANNNYAELASDLDKQDICFKQRYWSVEHNNQKFNKNKAWLGVASSASKIFVITLATTGTALGLCTAPWVLSLMAIGIAVDSLGLTKSLYESSREMEIAPKRTLAIAV
ncbi:MAG: hypothetical protein H0X29_00720 [Parachlamydiaceae bacterium]|nr:hypothetical protein [Parachlamydiaceae bacterium]